MQILARLPRSPRFSPEIAGSADIAGQEWMIACWDWKNWRGCRTGLPGLQTAAQKCRDCRGCWECRIFSPRLPEVLAKIVEIATEVAGRHCRDCRDCRSAEIADISNPVRSPRLPPKLAGIANIAGRECVIACWDRKKWRGCQTGLTWSQSLPPKIAEIAEVAGSEESAEFAVRNCQDPDGECRPTLRRLQRLLRLPRMQILARLPRSPRFSPEIAGSADIAGQEWMIACWDWKNWRGCRTGLPGLQTAAQKCRDCRGCWECRIFSPRLPEVLAKIVEIATEVAGRHCRDCRDCRSAEIADISNPVRSPRLPPKLAGIANIAGRECVIACWDRKKWRGCQTGITLLQRMPPKNAEIAEVAGSEENAEFGDRECQDCDGGCRPTLRRLQRLLRLPRMQILARLPRSPRLLPQLAGIPDFAGREWVIACWDGKNWRGCQTGLTWSQSLPPKIAEIAEVAGREESAKFADRNFQDCDAECRPTLRRLQRLLSLPRMQILSRLSRSPRFSPETAGSADIAGQEWMIACCDWKHWRGCRTGLPGLETAAQKCREWRGCWECRIFSPILLNVLAKIVKIATEFAGRHCRDCRDYRSAEIADISNLVRSPRLSTKIGGIADFAGRECVIAFWDRKKRRGCQAGITLLQRLPPKNAEIAEVAGSEENAENGDRECQDCDGGSRPTLRRLQRLLRLPRMQILARLPRSPRLSPEIAGITDFAGREWVIAFWDRKKRRGCQAGITLLQRLPPKNAEIAEVAGSEENAENGDRECQDCDGGSRPTLRRLQRLVRFPRMQILARLPRSPRLSLEIAGITDFAGREWVIACWDWKKWRGCQTGLTWSQSLPPKIAEIAEVAGREESAKFADRICQDCDGECRPTLRRLQRLLRLPRMQILARLPRSPRFSPEIAGSADIAGQEWMIACWDRKKWRGCRMGLPGLETAAQKCWDCQGCWECRFFSPRLPKVLAKIVEIATEIAGRHCRDCRDCRSAEIADISNPVRSPRLPPKLAGIANIAGRECVIACWDRKKWRGCQTGITLLQRMPPKNAEIAEVAGSEENAKFGDRECQDCDGGCRPTLRRLQRLLRLPRMQILARLPRSPRLLPQLAGIPDFAGREWVIARWDEKNWRGCQTGLTWSQSLPPKIAESGGVAGSEENAEFGDRDCQDCDGGCRPTLRRLQRLQRLPRMQIFARLPKSLRLSTKIAGITDFAGREWVIACWDGKNWRGCQTGLTWSQSLPPKIAEIAEVAGREESAKFADRNFQDCDAECRPTLRRLQRLLSLPRMQILLGLSRSPRFSPETAGSADIAGQEWMIACWDWKHWRGCRTGLPGLETAAQKCREWRGCWECRIFSPILPNVLAKIVKIATEIAGRHCRDCRDYRNAEIADISNLVRSPRLSPKIGGIADFAGRECVIAFWDRKKRRGCQAGITLLQRLPPKDAESADVAGSEENAENGDRECQDCDGGCRPTLRRLQRLLRLPRMQILARLPRSPRLSPEIAGITDFAGREWVIACWDRKKWRGCQTGLTWSQSLPPKIAEIATKNVGRHCGDCRG